MMEYLMDKKSPAVTVQGVLLASSILYLQQGESNLLVFLTVVILLSLFFLQVINHRFFYYFPYNQFAEKETPDIDT